MDKIIKMVDRMFRKAESGSPFRLDPTVWLFDKTLKEQYDKTVVELKTKGYDFIDINEYVKIKPEDYEMKIKDMGFDDESGTIRIKDIKNFTDVRKRRMIVKAKLNNLKNEIGKKTILLINYNNLYLNDEMFYNGENNMLYELIRIWLKDGYCFDNKPSDKYLCALVYCETEERISDFCLYSFKAKED